MLAMRASPESPHSHLARTRNRSGVRVTPTPATVMRGAGRVAPHSPSVRSGERSTSLHAHP